MKSKNGPTVSYRLVCCWIKRPIFKLGKGGFFLKVGFARGILVEAKSSGIITHHYPEDYLRWKHEQLSGISG